MPLSVGEKLGPYEILAPIGAGGMGEVYRARDTKLDRDVAIKVLPAALAQHPDRLARFEREAKVLAAMNHPNIAIIHGLEEISSNARAIVMELVEGPTLADRIAKGAIPLDESLKISAQIADALEAAHDKGVVHRDLKPANVKVREDGTVKVLDFGLATAVQDEPRAAGENSPTLTMGATEAGVILGTAAYMSPEQASGRRVDKRADIWSFGVVLWEMLTGKRLFDGGETMSHTLADVLRAEIDFGKLPAATPTAIRGLLKRCLDRDVKTRLRDIGEARVMIAKYLADPASGTEVQTQAGVGTTKNQDTRLPWALAGVLLLALGLLSFLHFREQTAPAPLMNINFDLGPDADLSSNTPVILSPDGTRIVYTSQFGGKKQLSLRPLNQPRATPLAGTENAQHPFFSPDGQWIGFAADGKLMKVSVSGGAAIKLCDARSFRGASWGENGVIVVALGNPGSLGLVPEAGGEPKQILAVAQGDFLQGSPQVLPGAKAAIFSAGRSVDAVSLPDGARKMLIKEGEFGRYLPTRTGAGGHLVYVSQGTLFAMPFDPGRLEASGTPTPLLEDVPVASGAFGLRAPIDFSSGSGALVYVSGKATTPRTLAWLDGSGKTQVLPAAPGIYTEPRVSPDGKRVAVKLDNSIWIYDLDRDSVSRLTTGQPAGGSPVWTPDSRRIAFGFADSGSYGYAWLRVDGSGEPQRLTSSTNRQYGASFSPDGKHMVYMDRGPEGNYDLLTLAFDRSDPENPKPGKPEPFLRSKFGASETEFSPDGRWIAYMSSELGRNEVFVRPFPGPGRPQQISTGGGSGPVWSRRELFWQVSNGIMVAGYTTGADTLLLEKPRLWSNQRRHEGGSLRNFDLAPDGKHMLVLLDEQQDAAALPTHVNLLLNFFDEVRRRVPGGK